MATEADPPAPPEPPAPAPGEGGSGARTFTVGAVVVASLDAFFRRIGYFVVLGVTCHLPYFIAVAAMRPSAGGLDRGEILFLDILAPMVCGGVLAAMAIHEVILEANGGRPSPADTLRAVAPRLLPVLLVSLISQFLIVLGLVVLVVPGLMAACFLWVATPATLIERTGVFESLSRSMTLTKGRRWPIFGLFLIYAVVLEGAPIAMIEGYLSLSENQGTLVEDLLYASVYALLAPIYAIATAYAYIFLKIEKEGVDVEALAEVFA